MSTPTKEEVELTSKLLGDVAELEKKMAAGNKPLTPENELKAIAGLLTQVKELTDLKEKRKAEGNTGKELELFQNLLEAIKELTAKLGQASAGADKADPNTLKLMGIDKRHLEMTTDQFILDLFSKSEGPLQSLLEAIKGLDGRLVYLCSEVNKTNDKLEYLCEQSNTVNEHLLAIYNEIGLIRNSK